MEKADEITMNQGERKKLYIVRQALDGKINQSKAAEILGLCIRQVRRLVKRVKQTGDGGIVHGGRGRKSKRRMPETVKKKVLSLCRSKYIGFGPTLVSEKIAEELKITISKETVRSWMRSEALPYRRRRNRPHRSWRPRKEHCGEMVQMDGSHHKWFEDRRPKAVLMGYIDDATSRVYARFYDYEGTIPALDSLTRYIRLYGIPCSLYVDRHTTYKSNGKMTIHDELQGKEMPLSQFTAAAERIGIKVIHAYSPQAKGRVERLFKTLQDRLVKEMTLHNICSVEEANKFLKQYLPTFNKKFQVASIQKKDLHRGLYNGIHLEWILCMQETRELRNDFTVTYYHHVFQVLEHSPAKRVTVQQNVKGRFRIMDKGRSLKFKEISKEVLRSKKVKNELPVKPHKPPLPGPNHPWKRFRLPGSNPPLVNP